MKVKEFFTARNVAFLGVLTALTVVLQLWGSAVRVGGIELNFALIPIVLAATILGPLSGAFIGFVVGLIIYITTALMGGNPFTHLQFQLSPVLLTVVCIGKTTVAGLVAGLLYKLIAKKSSLAGSFVASIAVPVINTGLYVLGCVLMKEALFLSPPPGHVLDPSTSVWALFGIVFLIIWINFVLEMVVNIVLAPAIDKIIRIVEKSIRK